MTDIIEKLPLTSMDMTDFQREKLKALFPEVFTEGNKIDFEKLRLTLGENVDAGKERFGLNWAGKSNCFQTIKQSSVATLVPARDESVDFDTTENLYIEGDNLEVLKLLQKSYLGKVKMIYIDPPYNTGSDFIYPDNYAENLNTYLEYTGQVDGEGRPISTNKDTDGRFHSKWLNMMYPRLFLAKNLLREDGVIVIQIDDNEQANLKRLCDEIFGEENFISCVSVKMSHLSGMKMSHVSKKIPKIKEFLFFYGKNKDNVLLNKVLVPCSWDDAFDRYTRVIDDPKLPVQDWTFSTLNNCLKEIEEDKQEQWCIANAHRIIRTAVNDSFRDSPKDGIFRDVVTATGLKKISFNREEVLFASDKLSVVDKRNVPVTTIGDIWTDIGINNLHNEGDIEFDNGKKPIKLIHRIIKLVEGQTKDSIILDFFSGSSTTAHAVIQHNLEDCGNRKFIMVQLPEPCDKQSEAFKAGYKNLAEIGKERIRRVIKKIKTQQTENEAKADLVDKLNESNAPLDLGFKVFKLQKSNFKVWDANIEKTPEAIQFALDEFVDHINPQAEQESILFELLLKSGFDLTTPIEKLMLSKKIVFSIADGALLICLEKALTHDVISDMAKRSPSRVICLDEGFQNNDQLKTNAVLIMKNHGIEVFRTV